MKAQPIPSRCSALLTLPVRLFLVAALLCSFAGAAGAQEHSAHHAAADTDTDPRVGLKAGWKDAAIAAHNIQLVAHVARPEGFFNPANPGDFGFMNSDMAFSGNNLFLGNFSGVQIWDISDPTSPRLRVALNCPGGQGDVSVHQNLLFVSVEETRGRLDCGPQGVAEEVSSERFRGVRIFDISNVEQPQQVAAVQTCRGSHTHTLVPDLNDPANVYLYVSGTSGVRPGAELAGCSALSPDEDPNTSLFRIEVIKVPVATPQQARVVNTPRIFADSASGNIAGLWMGGTHGEDTQMTSVTNQCHDITVYPELGLAAGACSGNGILLDISDPENPVRIDEVVDPNFAYWHSATFSNDGKKVLFTDEWGGGLAPRCRETDRPEWGANALFTIEDGTLNHQGYYKLPAPQTTEENCVAHNGSLVPIPGRDVMAQAWYQGGLSVFDFTDPAHPVEIAYFDRGPMDSTRLVMAGYWSAYWYDGYLYASEIGRGLDVFKLMPSEHLTLSEIAAAEAVRESEMNPQNQTKVAWQASFNVAHAYLDQLERHNGLSAQRVLAVREALADAEAASPAAQPAALTALATTLDAEAENAPDAARVRMLAETVRELATSTP